MSGVSRGFGARLVSEFNQCEREWYWLVYRVVWALDSDITARLAQSVERKALNLVVVGSSPTVGNRFHIYTYPTTTHTLLSILTLP